MSTIAGRRFELDRGQATGATADLLPVPLRDHYVVIEGRHFLPSRCLPQ